MTARNPRAAVVLFETAEHGDAPMARAELDAMHGFVDIVRTGKALHRALFGSAGVVRQAATAEGGEHDGDGTGAPETRWILHLPAPELEAPTVAPRCVWQMKRAAKL